MSTRITKREMAFELVSTFGRYVADAPKSKYYVRLMGRSFHSPDTADLVDRVAKELSRDDLIAQMKHIPDGEEE